jgi:antitoxin VapB
MSEVAEWIEAELHSDGNGQSLTLPPQLHIDETRVYVGRDQTTGDIVITRRAPLPRRSWEEIFADIDAAGFPEDFMADRDQGNYSEREPL